MTSRAYRVEWLEATVADLEGIAYHLWLEAPLRAEHLLSRLVDHGESLKRLPERGHRIPELQDLGDRTWREVREGHWRIIYRVVGRTVEIHGVFDSRRHLDEILRERMLRS